MNPRFEKYVAETTSKLENPGLLLVSTNKDGKSNVMTIGWGLIGVFWRMPVFMVAVRPSRYTYDFIKDSGEFTVNVPGEGLDDVVQHCGEVSGREHDKFSECKLNLLKAKKVKVPVIKECKIHYECRVVHQLKVAPSLVPASVKKTLYPRGDYHTLYFGKILAVYKRRLSRLNLTRELEGEKMLVEEIWRELEGYVDAEEKGKRIHWEEQYHVTPRLHGVPTSVVRKVSSKYFQRVKKTGKRRILRLCEELLSSGYTEERAIAFDWAFRIRRSYEPSDFYLLESWLKKYVHGWGGCDDLCTHALGTFIFQFPQFIPRVKEWAKSTNTWLRRACAVVMIYSVRRKKRLEDIFEIADLLLRDSDIMVQKGYGWMLKEASNRFPREVFKYVMKNKKEMPRTPLRYAIEKLPSEKKKEAMKTET
jgi:3-methyladenine DNA glycosylase AlkD/flavin reductase (DIM6/NTAB) family NADH-FMN oxidoreductase RutF